MYSVLESWKLLRVWGDFWEVRIVDLDSQGEESTGKPKPKAAVQQQPKLTQLVAAVLLLLHRFWVHLIMLSCFFALSQQKAVG